jgi:trafficking protein particle complex subunit 10
VSTGDDNLRTQGLGTPVERPDSRSGPKPFVKERRHQIPGLRQTPYLKVLFVRCDDSDTYKAHTRRLVREWIKDHTPSSQSTTKLNAQENHDAFEWLIIHIVIPNTAAATQPRTSWKSTDGTTGSATEKARWRGGGSSTILEKLRADFNSSSKSAIDRVAQIRIGINDVPYEVLPRVVPAIPGSYTESPQEHDEAWSDLISKFKLLILASFDMRVAQYEEDIREKDAQRTLPGWNFCTFFMLKEGLARGFESVGLVEDALVGYDELAVGLDGTIREQAMTGSTAEHSGSFLPYTKELKMLVDQARTRALKDMGHEAHVAESDGPINLQSADDASEEADEIPLNATKKRYRELILSSNISIFDFRCYLFSRQLSLLLRLANASSSQEELLARLKEQRESSLQGVAARFPASQPADDVENLAVLGQICKRSMDFIASIGRIMREDISASYMTFQQKIDDEEGSVGQMDPITIQVVDNIVSSFTFSVAQQILAQTATKALPIPPSTLGPAGSKTGLDGQEPKSAIPEPKTMMHPARSSSLAIRSPSREPQSPGIFPGGRRASVPGRDRSPTVSTSFLKPGLEELAAHRAELYLISRRVLENIGKERGWSVGWEELAQYGKISYMEDVDLKEETSEENHIHSHPLKAAFSQHGINGKLLRVALDNQDDFFRLYETLTDKSLRHYTVANHVQSVQSSMADLAVLKYHLGDYAAASSYLYRMTPFYGEDSWTQIEFSMLVMYAKCLRQLQRKDEYVRVVLKLLSRAASAEKERIALVSTKHLDGNASFNHEELVPDESYLDELLQITATFQREVQVPLQNFFSHVEVDDTPRYHSGKDSFALQLRLRYLLSEDMNVDKARVRIAPIVGDPSREIWLESDGPVSIKKGFARVLVQSNVSYGLCHLCTSYLLHTDDNTRHISCQPRCTPCQ